MKGVTNELGICTSQVRTKGPLLVCPLLSSYWGYRNMAYSRVIKHTRCPRCAKLGKDRRGNNLAVYSDGHSYCYGCAYYGHPPDSLVNMGKKLYKYSIDSEKRYEFGNVTRNYRLPDVCLSWLRNYSISDDDIRTHGFFWDAEKSLLVMPVLDADRIVLTASRYFGTNPDYPKYVTKGYKANHFKLINPKDPTDVYVLCEDYLSAIRIGRVANAIPLFGAHAPRELILNLCAKRPRLRFWLDRDKALEAVRQASRARQYIPNCATIVTELDPKEYSDQQIKSIIDESILQPPESLPEQGTLYKV